jgi:hypothetical protein
MGRPRKSTAELERSGSFEKHPERKAARANEPKPDGPLGAPPTCFDPASYTGAKLLAIWQELVSQAPPGVLTSADRAHLELACRLYYRIRSNPNAKIGDFNRLSELLGKMGMNPADRSKVNITASIPGGTANERNSGNSNVFEELADEERSASSIQ